jgi:hypothetical protein
MKTAKKAVRKQKSIPLQLTEAAIDAFELSKSGFPLDRRLREECIHEGLRACYELCMSCRARFASIRIAKAR